QNASSGQNTQKQNNNKQNSQSSKKD
ncbi:DUF4887 domain-containing protein, partial [Bacillus velezensis]|nr:DUF4887 domain-containing protein [Bacillus velezensis]